MKKYIIKIGVLVCFVTLSVVGIQITNNSHNTIGLVFDNIEALASDAEGGASITCCAGFWGECKLADGSIGKGPLIKCEF